MVTPGAPHSPRRHASANLAAATAMDRVALPVPALASTTCEDGTTHGNEKSLAQDRQTAYQDRRRKWRDELEIEIRSDVVIQLSRSRSQPAVAYGAWEVSSQLGALLP
jgi:hypothetical protein